MDMEISPLAMTALMLLLFNLIVYLKRSPFTPAVLFLFLVAGWVACRTSPALLTLTGTLVLVGVIFIWLRVGSRFVLLGSLILAVMAHTIDFFTQPEFRVEGWAKLTKWDVYLLRRKYPVESLSGRLDSGLRRNCSLSTLPDEISSRAAGASWNRLSYLEVERLKPVRTRALELLHDSSVAAFVKRPEFGWKRMPAYPTPVDLDQEAESSVWPNGTVIELDEVDSSSASGLRATTEFMEHRLWNVHRESLVQFFNPDSFGYFRDRDHVAGFRPHAFRRMPKYDAGDKDRRWRLLRLELVGLLMHESPTVYVSEHLPSMVKVKRQPTRSLDGFESSALAALDGGQDIFPLRDGDTLRVLGSIRAAKQCLKCHEVKRGDLLGAFTYTLQKEGKP